MINPSVPKCSVIAMEEKRVLLWTVTDVNCMCLYFIFTGFSAGWGGEGGACQNIRIHEEEIFTILFHGSPLYFQNVTGQTKTSHSETEQQQRGTKKCQCFSCLF